MIAISLMGKCHGWHMETELLSYWKENLRHLFPYIPSQSQFNRRHRKLMGAINLTRKVNLRSLELSQDRHCDWSLFRLGLALPGQKLNELIPNPCLLNLLEINCVRQLIQNDKKKLRRTGRILIPSQSIRDDAVPFAYLVFYQLNWLQLSNYVL